MASKSSNTMTGDAVVHDLAHRAAVESGDRCPARHRLGQDRDRTARAIGSGRAVRARRRKLHLAGVIRLAIVDDPVAVDVRRHFSR